MTLLARIGGMRLMMRLMKSHFLKRCSLSERLKSMRPKNVSKLKSYSLTKSIYYEHHNQQKVDFKG